MNGDVVGDPLAQYLEQLDPAALDDWGRLAVLSWFDEALLDFVMDGGPRLDVVWDSPLVEPVDADNVDWLGRFRVRASLRERILAAQEMDSIWLVTYTAGMAAAYFGTRTGEIGDLENKLEELHYLSLSDPGGACFRLAALARTHIAVGAAGAAAATAAEAMRWTELRDHVDPRTADGRDRLARLADIVCTTASVLAAPLGGDGLLGRIRLLQVTIARAPIVGTAEERWILDVAESLIAVTLTDQRRLADADLTSALHGVDDWTLALAYQANRRAPVKQSHDITYVSAQFVRYRGSTTLNLEQGFARPVRPVQLALLPYSTVQFVHTLEARGQHDVKVPTLTVAQTYRLLSVAAVIEHAVPAPGLLAMQAAGVEATMAEVHRLQDLIEARLNDEETSSDTDDERYPWLQPLLTDMRGGLVVVGILDTGSPAAQVVHFEVHLPVQSPESSRWSGRAVTTLRVGRFAYAAQQLHLTIPHGLVAIGPTTPQLTPLGVAPGVGDQESQTFELVPLPAKSGMADLGIAYGIGPLERLKTVGAAAAVLFLNAVILWLSPLSADDLGNSGLLVLTLVVGLGGVAEVALRFQRRRPSRHAGRLSLRRPLRVTGWLTTAAWVVFGIGIVVAVVSGRTSVEADLVLGLSMSLAGVATALETVQLFADVRAVQRQTGWSSKPSTNRSRAAVQTPARGMLELIAVRTQRDWDRVTAALLRARPIDLKWSTLRGPGLLQVDEPVDWPDQGTAGRLTDAFVASRNQKLCIIGPPGSGKTALAALVASDLLQRRSSSTMVPVPVQLPLATWRPSDESLARWVARRLAAGPGRRAEIADLVDGGSLTVILDGLDELNPSARSRALRGVEQAGQRASVIITCRTAEYETATSPAAVVLSSASVIKVEPLATTALPQLPTPELPSRGHGLRELLRTPEAIQLEAIDAFGQQRDGYTIEQRLTDAAVLRAYEWGDDSRSWIRPEQVRRWLELLALLATKTSNGIDWFDLHRIVSSPVRTAVAVLTSAAVASTAIALGALLLSPTEVRAPSAMVLGLLAAAVVVAALSRTSPLRLDRRSQVWTNGVFVALCVVAALVDVGAAFRSTAWVLAAVAGGFLVGGIAALPIRRRLAWGYSRHPLTARQSLRIAFSFALLEAWLPTLTTTVCLATAAPMFGAENAFAAGAVAISCSVLPIMLGPWGWYHFSRIVFASRGQLPWRLMSFLEDAANRRLLRRRGFGFEFRHATYQETLTPVRRSQASGPTLHYAAAQVGRFFRQNQDEEFDDYQVCRRTGLMPTQTYPALRRFVDLGWLASRWEDPAQLGVPRRMFYQLTEDGRADLGGAVAGYDLVHAGSRTARKLARESVAGVGSFG